ncbi:MAG: helicase-related protein [Candidatus Bathyarchaeia archaeon]
MLEDGRLNVLVATSIAEKGLDIPSIDHVIFYEPIPSEICYIQRRGGERGEKPWKSHDTSSERKPRYDILVRKQKKNWKDEENS